MTEQSTAELHRLVAEEPLPTTAPDLDILVAAGHRRLRNRRVALGATALAAVAAVSVPTALLAGGPGKATDPAEDNIAAPPVPTATGDCGQLLCGDPRKDSEPERAALAGDPWVVGELADGTEEVIYAATTEGFDLGTNERATVDVLMIGHRDDGELNRVAWTVQPGSEAVSPDGSPVRFWTNRSLLGADSGDEYLVVGFVAGTPDEITWSTPDGASGPVDGMSTAVIGGHTAFYLTQPYPEGYEQPEARAHSKVTRKEDGTFVDAEGNVAQQKDGELVLGDSGGDAFPPGLTIHTSDGWSCSIAKCGSMG